MFWYEKLICRASRSHVDGNRGWKCLRIAAKGGVAVAEWSGCVVDSAERKRT